MQLKELRQAIKTRFPGGRFETTDAIGTRMDKSALHCAIPRTYNVEEFDAFVRTLGGSSTWPACSQIYAYYRTVRI